MALIFRSRAMDTDILTCGLNAPNAKVVFDWLTSVEAQFSRFAPESELSVVNRHAGETVPISLPFADLFFEAARYFCETGGVFQPFLGDVMNRLGYDRTMALVRERKNFFSNPVEEKPGEAESVQFNLEEQCIQMPKGTLIDFGGIAKGWSVERIAQQIIERTASGLISAGGDLMSWGYTDSDPVTVGIEHPFSQRTTIGKLFFSGKTGAATSSANKRRWKNGDTLMHHIIDPRTGHSSESDCIQATVIGRSLLLCDVYAKCLLIQGSTDGPEWIRSRHPELAWIMICKNGELISSENLSDYCRRIDLPQRIAVH
jgi:Membrane-associated lipoprotein involved in thiamine biosynthesis